MCAVLNVMSLYSLTCSTGFQRPLLHLFVFCTSTTKPSTCVVSKLLCKALNFCRLIDTTITHCSYQTFIIVQYIFENNIFYVTLIFIKKI